MSAIKKLSITLICALFALPAWSAETIAPILTTHTLASDTLTQQLGWVEDKTYYCGGYYLEEPLNYTVSVEKRNAIEITSDQTLFSQRGTSILEGKVTITRQGQQITANKAYLYRNPVTGKLSAVDMIGNVHLREPGSLVIAHQGRYNFETGTKSLSYILYRTAIYDKSSRITHQTRKITSLTAWGKAFEFSQTEPLIYELRRTSYSTCPPTNQTWKVKANHIVLNKDTGRGYATHARILVKGVPVFYTPYINFPIDNRRKTGFLWPTYGATNTSGPSFFFPFYWNLAPNYDTTITPAILFKRGTQLSDSFRYLTETSEGNATISFLPNDRYFQTYKKQQETLFANSNNTIVQAELNRLRNDSSTRKAFFWREHSRFNEHWNSHVDFNYAGDDYYLQDFGTNLNEITQNQLLQEGDVTYKGQNWNFLGRLQAYQTLHPVVENQQPPVLNQYRRFPQLSLNADYPDQLFGLEYFLGSEVTHFEILKTPGSNFNLPIGNRFHLQPGMSLPVILPYFYITPRFQVALTDYNLSQNQDTNTPASIQRGIPIFDVASGLYLTRDTSLFNNTYQQTLEPQVYYTYIPYHNQSDIPVFDTTVNTLTYDQIFNYNRFSGIDRIGDANQIGLGVTTRLIDDETGLEKLRLGIGEIIYFANRLVTLCQTGCSDNPENHSNYQRLSPISGLLNFNIIRYWTFNSNAIWNPVSKKMDNTTLGLQYETDNNHILNLGYNFARRGDVQSGITSDTSRANLQVTDFSFAWPVIRDFSAVGLWSQDWHHRHLQNLLYGLQYDTCCWAVRFVGGRAFSGIDSTNNNKYQYNNQFYIQFSLKGLGNIGSGNPNGLLSHIGGYNPQFGQDVS